MKILINEIKINYRVSGQGQPVILMHGWGQNIEMMSSIQDCLEHQYLVYNIDLPGFGQSEELNENLSIDGYVQILKQFIQQQEITNPILIGHSFGCRIALKYATQYQTKAMVLTGAAGIKDRYSPLYYIRVYFYKFFKLFKDVPFVKHYVLEMMNNAGSSDYRNSSANLKEVLKNAVNTDLTEILQNVKCQVLLIFGSKDQATPVWMGSIMEKLIPQAKLIVYEDMTHYAYLENKEKFCEDVHLFLKDVD
ncbi:MAG: alpha/beta fold hydrolase [Bacilli bacterium]